MTNHRAAGRLPDLGLLPWVSSFHAVGATGNSPRAGQALSSVSLESPLAACKRIRPACVGCLCAGHYCSSSSFQRLNCRCKLRAMIQRRPKPRLGRVVSHLQMCDVSLVHVEGLVSPRSRSVQNGPWPGAPPGPLRQARLSVPTSFTESPFHQTSCLILVSGHPWHPPLLAIPGTFNRQATCPLLAWWLESMVSFLPFQACLAFLSSMQRSNGVSWQKSEAC